jgi:hypothetical protein
LDTGCTQASKTETSGLGKSRITRIGCVTFHRGPTLHESESRANSFAAEGLLKEESTTSRREATSPPA